MSPVGNKELFSLGVRHHSHKGAVLGTLYPTRGPPGLWLLARQRYKEQQQKSTQKQTTKLPQTHELFHHTPAKKQMIPSSIVAFLSLLRTQKQRIPITGAKGASPLSAVTAFQLTWGQRNSVKVTLSPTPDTQQNTAMDMGSHSSADLSLAELDDSRRQNFMPQFAEKTFPWSCSPCTQQRLFPPHIQPYRGCSPCSHPQAQKPGQKNLYSDKTQVLRAACEGTGEKAKQKTTTS